MIGVSRETVSRLIAEFEEQGLLELGATGMDG